MSELDAGAPGFSEKSFYLQEFRGRTLAIAAQAADLRRAEPLAAVVGELVVHGARVCVLSTERAALDALLAGRVLSAAMPRLEGAVWRALRRSGSAGLLVGGSLAFAPACRDVALRLGVGKLVWLDRDGGLAGPGGERLSFVHLEELQQYLASDGARARRLALLREVERMLTGGIPAVNVCTLEGLADELFTYAGSGTLFTRERYMHVRRLGIDDFDAAADLLRRGVDEGFLAPRSDEEIDQVLASGFGAFVEGAHLAGIGALLVDEVARMAEVASLYTLTRFLGEGVGGHLLTYAVERAIALGLSAVFACTTEERVASFFLRQGFREAGQGEVPASKWKGYDGARRARVRCFRRELTPASA
ncbi:MAG: GNAT family N-acetyltransferase [Deltaproteobacteria bacterium]|nr:GNAT family N-acetyltransferase [Deltaproteobacteria bacterium]